MEQLLLPALLSLAGLGAIFGGGLAFASKKFYVEIDPRVERIIAILPGANCGACGSPGCAGFADRIVADKAKVTDCIPGGPSVAELIAEIMGVEAGATQAMVAVVRCAGDVDNAVNKYKYFGVETCTAANLLGGGHKACQYGCTGFADCVKVCKFDALHMGSKGLPVVNDDNCTGCGLCVEACPKNIMDMIPASAQIYLACSSQDMGKDVSNACSVGCNGCKVCVNPRNCPSGAITMNGNLPVVDYSIEDNLIVPSSKCAPKSYIDKIKYRPKFTIDSKCNSCGECAKICPVKKCITGEEDEIYRIDQELCIGCGWCVPVCEPKAIHIIGALGYQHKDVG